MKRYIRGNDIMAREIDEVVFLVNPSDQTVFHLNATGGALWRLLENPTSATEAMSLLHKVFPSTDKAEIESDVLQLLNDFVRRGLIRVHD